MSVNPCLQGDWEENWHITHFLHKECPSSSLCANAESSSPDPEPCRTNTGNSGQPSWGQAGTQIITELHPPVTLQLLGMGSRDKSLLGCAGLLDCFSPCSLPKPRQEDPKPGSCCGRNAFPTGAAGIPVSTKTILSIAQLTNN